MCVYAVCNCNKGQQQQKKAHNSLSRSSLLLPLLSSRSLKSLSTKKSRKKKDFSLSFSVDLSPDIRHNKSKKTINKNLS